MRSQFSRSDGLGSRPPEAGGVFMFRKLLAILLINGLIAPPFQALQPLYAMEPGVPLPSRVAGSEAMQLAQMEAEELEEVEVSEGLAPTFEFAVEDAGLAVSVGFADSATPSSDFPTPWQGAPNVVYIGGGTPVNAGAIRL